MGACACTASGSTCCSSCASSPHALASCPCFMNVYPLIWLIFCIAFSMGWISVLSLSSEKITISLSQNMETPSTLVCMCMGYSAFESAPTESDSSTLHSLFRVTIPSASTFPLKELCPCTASEHALDASPTLTVSVFTLSLVFRSVTTETCPGWGRYHPALLSSLKE